MADGGAVSRLRGGEGVKAVLATPPRPPLEATELDQAVEAALVYADLFDAPLSAEDVWRYLPGVVATREAVQVVLALVPAEAAHHFLPTRRAVVAQKQWRAEASRRLWQQARRFGHVLRCLPFVELVAVTGSLAVDNADDGDDVDLMLVVRPGRLWSVRALAIVVARLARLLGGARLCPNYLVASTNLALRQQDLFVAHELFQMVPLHGAETYRRLLAENAWARVLLPNAEPRAVPADPPPAFPRRLAEWLLGGAVGEWIERWEARRKIARFQPEAAEPGGEAVFTADECKGHLDGHGARTLARYERRLEQLRQARALLAADLEPAVAGIR